MQRVASFNAGFDVFPARNPSLDDAANQQEHEKKTQQTPSRRPEEPPNGPDNTNRRYLNLPPVVNGRLQYTNKQLKYRPFPADTDPVRDKLFRLEQPVLLDSQQIADYWTHMSNVYQRSTQPELMTNDTVLESWECRNRRRVTLNNKPSNTDPGSRNRRTKSEVIGEIDQCKVRIKLVHYTKHAKDMDPPCAIGLNNCKCIPEWLHIEHTVQTRNSNFKHTHDITVCDQFKRSNALMYACKLKVEEHYAYPAVARWAKEKYGAIAQETQFITKQDITNASKWWRLANKEVGLRSEIVDEESPDERRRDQCMDAIEATSSVERLRRALAEVCAKYPDAVDVVLPLMEAPTSNGDGGSGIREGWGFEMPSPGLPSRRYRPEEANGPALPVPPQGGEQPFGAVSPSLPHKPPPPSPPPSIQANGQAVPPGVHPLHVPAHLVARYVSTQNEPPQSPPILIHVFPQEQANLSDPNATSRDFMTAASATKRYSAPYPNSSSRSVVATPPSTSIAELLTPDKVPHGPPLGTGWGFHRPSWAVPEKRKADAPATGDIQPAKRPTTTADTPTGMSNNPSDDIDLQLQKELQA